MKTPKAFIPKKDLENEIHRLAKKFKNQTSKNILESDYKKQDCKMIYNQAKDIAEKLGKLDTPFYIHNFEDKKTGMVIEYAAHWGKNATHLRIDTRNKHAFDIVFESVQHTHSKRQKVSAYIPGTWEDRLKEIFQKI